MLKRHKQNKSTPKKIQPVFQTDQYPAKTWIDSQEMVRCGRTVKQHSMIVGAVAAKLLDGFPDSVRSLFPSGSPLAAACHDVGKISPTFTKKILDNLPDHEGKSYPSLVNVNTQLERNWGGHAGVTRLTLEHIDVGPYLPELLGKHHGYTPQTDMYRATGEVFGGQVWQDQREELITAIRESCCMDWPVISSFAQAQLVAGLTTVADWIGSGSLFDDPDKDWRPLVDKAVVQAGFMPPRIRPGLSFGDVFGGFVPRPIQKTLVECADRPGVYVLEASMGLGKTEAALYAAYRVMEAGKASGIYFALPTRLTSNKIYGRFNDFLKTVLKEECPNRQALLLHGNAWLLEQTDLGGEGSPGGSWFSQRKRGLLAPFGVGTIDQALMAVMNVKHGFVRAFGLVGKVVILDEVHTYDAYTGTILDALVSFLRAIGCTVIILSATLSMQRRGAILGAEVGEEGYPLVTVMSATGRVTEKTAPVAPGKEVKLSWPKNPEQVINEALSRALEGQQVLWIENTVGEAQQCYLDLAARCADLGLECGLLHSRCTVSDREKKEEYWVSLYGKKGGKRRLECGRILVGTQVLEQSLDIDADFLVTRFAPLDMLLQRMGRLWRHASTPRSTSAVREAWILAPELKAAVSSPTSAFGASAWVYSPYVLCRSLETLEGRPCITLPDDIRPLINATYDQRTEEGKMVRWQKELINGVSGPGRPTRMGIQALRQFACLTLAQGGKTLSDKTVKTRYSEEEGTDVLLVRAMRPDPETQTTRITFLGGEFAEVPWKKQNQSRGAWRRLTARLMREVLQVRPFQAPVQVRRNILQKLGLHHCFYLGKPEYDESLLRVALVGEDDVLHGLDGHRVNEDYDLTYRYDIGYLAEKKEGTR
jgi:CRISPR-associated endonuclease/helicase Cas3